MKLKCLGSSSKGNNYLLIGKKETLIIEAGIAFNEVKKSLNFNISNVAGCCISHFHNDHFKAAKDINDCHIGIYSNKEVIDKLGSGNVMKAKTLYRIGGFIVYPLNVFHDVKTFAFVIIHIEMGSLLFITDTGKFPYKVPDVNHILIEANFDNNLAADGIINGSRYNNLDRLSENHMSIDECEKVISNNLSKETRNIVLLHLSDGNSNAENFKSRIRKKTGKPVYIADENLEIELN